MLSFNERIQGGSNGSCFYMDHTSDTTSASLGDVRANQHIAHYDPQHDLNQLQQLFSNGLSALTADQFQDAHDTFDQLQDHIEKNVIPACMALRAYTCQRQESYQEGLNIANEYTSKKSEDVDGYLLSANMYLLNNNQRAAALDVYRRGVKHCDKQHPRYDDLVKHKDRLEEDIKRQNSHLIRILPREVLHTILSYMERWHMIELAYTCTAWYELVMDWPGFWYEIIVTNDDLLGDQSACRRFLNRAPPQYVRKLVHRGGGVPERFQGYAFERIADFRWNWLEELCKYMDGHNNSAAWDSLTLLIQQSGVVMMKIPRFTHQWKSSAAAKTHSRDWH